MNAFVPLPLKQIGSGHKWAIKPQMCLERYWRQSIIHASLFIFTNRKWERLPVFKLPYLAAQTLLTSITLPGNISCQPKVSLKRLQWLWCTSLLKWNTTNTYRMCGPLPVVCELEPLLISLLVHFLTLVILDL